MLEAVRGREGCIDMGDGGTALEGEGVLYSLRDRAGTSERESARAEC